MTPRIPEMLIIKDIRVFRKWKAKHNVVKEAPRVKEKGPGPP
jgi:hypothetical protein